MSGAVESAPVPQPRVGDAHPYRWTVLAFLFCVTVINFVDRQALSVLAPIIRDAFHLSNTQYGTIVSWFQFGMVAGEFPMGWLMDRIGVQVGLAAAVLWWSAGSGLHALARSMGQFCAFRFWLGTGECGNYSGGNKVVAEWFPPKERAFAIGVFNSASMIGTSLAPLLVIPITQAYGWRAGFLVPSTLGVLWAIAWWFRYRPAAIPQSAATTGIAAFDAWAPVRTSSLLSRRQTWGLMLCRFWVGPVVQFYIYWMPSYFRDVRHLSFANSGYFTAVAYLFGDIGSVGGGVVAGWLIAKGLTVKTARRATLLAGASLCVLSLAVPLLSSIPFVIAAISVVLLGHTFLSANMFAAVSDLFPDRAVARVTGLTGVASGLSGIAFPIITGMIVDRVSYVPVFFMAALMPLVGVLILIATSGDFEPNVPNNDRRERAT